MGKAPIAAVLMFLAAGPVGPALAADPGASCAPNGTALQVAAHEKKFDKDCLAAPAGQAFTIEFDNQDPAVPHNVSIYDTSHGNKALFKGQVFFGPSKMTYSVPAQAAGTYEFRCDPHDDVMIGTFVVG